MLVEETLFNGTIDKVKIAIERIREFDPEGYTGRVYKLPFSGGKDSLVCYYLALMAGINFIPIKAPTPDPPELINYIRKNFKPVYTKPEDALTNSTSSVKAVYFEKYKKFSSRTQRTQFIGRPKTMWNLIANRKTPPTRLVRYCCSELKENVGEKGDTLILGVRREESQGRSSRGIVSFWEGKTCVNPIVDWSEKDVWEFIEKYNIPYCELYDQGFKRLGCIGCPLGSNQVKELERWPVYKKNYIRAFDRMLLNLDDKSSMTWKNGHDVYKWWVSKSKKDNNVPGQCSMF